MYLSRLLLSFVLCTLISNCKKADELVCAEKTWYRDSDNDSFGNVNAPIKSCYQPDGYVSNSDDLDDSEYNEAWDFSIPNKGAYSPKEYPEMIQIWNDEFTGEALNQDQWRHDNGNGCPNLCGWGNDELQYYRPNNAAIDEGYLIITGKSESYSGSAYTSSKIITKELFSLRYGRIDIRAALPQGQGIWPAFWLLGNNIDQVSWPACGEIDIMEKIGGDGNEDTVHGTVHWSHKDQHAHYGSSITMPEGSLHKEFHVYSIVWDKQSIQWLVNNEPYHEIDISVPGLETFHQEFYLIINLAIGGNWPGSPNLSTSFPQYLILDYIRVFQDFN